MRGLSWPAPSSAGQEPRCFIWAASCQVRAIVSPMRPMPCESESMTEMAPRSCRTSSAAIVSRPDARLGERDVFGHARVQVMAAMTMSRCSSNVFRVYGLVGFVEDGQAVGLAGDPR